ncbi:hypothetical protein, partial [Helicobacter sp. T3_23-1056]
MKLLRRFNVLICVMLCALQGEVYWDSSNEILVNDTLKALFIEKLFYKPLKTQREIVGEVKVLNIKRVENKQEVCKIFEGHYDGKSGKCVSDGRELCYAHPTTPKAMEDYILESIELPYDSYNSGYSFMEDNVCGYSGEVKIFGYVWGFESRSGGIELTRTIDFDENLQSIDGNPTISYKQGMIINNPRSGKKEAKKYLICKDKHCHPKA